MALEIKTYLYCSEDWGIPVFLIVDAYNKKRAHEKIMGLSKEISEEKPLKNWGWKRIQNDHPLFHKEREALFQVVDKEKDYSVNA